MRPAYYRLKELVLRSGYIQSDETTIPIINNEKHKTINGYIWMIRAVTEDLVFFHYDYGSRAQKVALQLFKDYQGVIQSDGYAVYDIYENKKGVLPIGCWAHARRYQYLQIIKSCLFLPLIISLLSSILCKTAFDNTYAKPFKKDLSFLSFSQGRTLISLSKMSRDAFSKDSLFSLESALA